jgi:hypothetical protein
MLQFNTIIVTPAHTVYSSEIPDGFKEQKMEGYNIVTLLYSILRCMLVTTHTTFVGTQKL